MQHKRKSVMICTTVLILSCHIISRETFRHSQALHHSVNYSHVQLLNTNPDCFVSTSGPNVSSSKHLKPALLHYCGGKSYAGIAEFSLENSKEYAKRHELDVLVANSDTFPTESFFTPKAWVKLAFMLQILEMKQYSWLLWLDCDVLITSLHLPVEPLLDSLNVSHDHDIVVAKDIGNSPFNTGVLLVRVSDWTVKTVARALRYAEDPSVREHGWWEQKALHLLYNENKHEEQLKILVVQDRWRLNAFANLGEERSDSFAWHRVNCRNQSACDQSFKKKFCHVHNNSQPCYRLDY